MTLPALKCNNVNGLLESCASEEGSGRTGFTLIEMLLVLVLVSILTAITLPNFVQSIRGNRLRTAVRSVVMAGRYTRSMAVLRQQELVLTFDLNDASMKVEEIVMRPVDDVTQPPLDEEDAEGAPKDVSGYGIASRTELLKRKLDQVLIASVEVGDQVITEGTASIIYSNNGRCAPYIVKVTDVEGRGSVIEVDALSSARTEGM